MHAHTYMCTSIIHTHTYAPVHTQQGTVQEEVYFMQASGMWASLTLFLIAMRWRDHEAGNTIRITFVLLMFIRETRIAVPWQ